MYLLIYAYLVVYSINGMLSEELAPKVDTPYGEVVGTYGYSYGGRKYEIFQGIPYAKPPVEKLRFESPQPIDKWDNTLFATKESNVCLQYLCKADHDSIATKGKEDCLYLNIYVPVIENRNEPLPVVFSIHGGAFRGGVPFTNVTFIMDRDVIFISFNYRLGLFGFLSTHDHHITGNMGLKDQSMALSWVSKNIQYFGGDPKRITLLGQSAGAASVHYHYLSPLSRGLFQNGISFSGSSLAAGKLDKQPFEKFKKLATIMECPIENIPETVECLRNKPAEELAIASSRFLVWLINPLNLFGPVAEKDSEKPFINRSPIDILRSGDVADVLWINSIVSEDGLVPSAQFVHDETYLKQLDENWNSIAPHLLMYNFSSSNENNEYSALIRKEYFEEEQITINSAKNIISLVTDRLYCTSAMKAAKLQAGVNKNDVLFWYYNFRAHSSFSEFIMQKSVDLGVCHTDDMKMIMGNTILNPLTRPEDIAVQSKLLDLVVSVASEGYPNVGQNFVWKKVDPDTEELEMLHFGGANNMKMAFPTNFCNHKFWDAINAREE